MARQQNQSAPSRRASARPVATPTPAQEVATSTVEEPVGDETLESLREEALQLEIEFDETYTVEDLTEIIANVEAAREAQAAEPEVSEAQVAPARPRGATGRQGGKGKAANGELERLKAKIGLPDEVRAKGNGLPDPTLADYQLAEKHGYPIVIPGAKAYKISIAIHCAFGGNLRDAGSVMLLTDRLAENKMEYLTPV